MIELRNDRFILIALLLGNIALRFLLVTPTGFDGLYGQDAYAYYKFAGELLDFARNAAFPGSFYWPAGYPFMLAIAQGIFGLSENVALYLNIILGSSVPALVYILSRQLNLQRSGATLAGLIMSFSPQAIQSSIVIMADIPGLFWGTLSAVLLMQYLKAYRRRWLILCALALALAALSRWIYLILVLPWGIALFMTLRGKVRWRDLFAAGIAAAFLFIPQILYSRVHTVGFLNHTQIAGWAISNAFENTFVTVDGTQHYASINGVFYLQPYLGNMYIIPLFAPLLFPGVLSFLQKRAAKISLLLLLWAALPYSFLIGMTLQNARFPLIVFPAVAILAGSGGEWILKRLNGIPQISRFAPITFAAIITFGLTHMLLNSFEIVTRFVSTHQYDKEVVTWAADRIPEGQTLYTFGLTLTAEHYTKLEVVELFHETPHTLDQRQHGSDDYLLLNIRVIENQWRGLSPQINYHWLAENRGLEPIGRMGNYTLFRILE